MRCIRVALDPPYDVCVGPDLLARLASLLPPLPAARRAALVTTESVARHHAAAVTDALTMVGLDVARLVVADGEQAKSLDTLGELYAQLAALPLGRDDVVVALGGGVVGDLAGLLAATWHRGVALVQLPTTVLAQVDAAIGGKTAINLPAGKNLVGAFHQPRSVVADTATLTTLPQRELRSGMAEIIKCGFIRDPLILDQVEAQPRAAIDPRGDLLVDLIGRAARVKAQVVADDVAEHGQRALLNYGHTLGHAIETLTGYERYRHGEAVGLGMRFAARVAELSGTAADGLAARTINLLAAVGLPVTCEPLDPARVFATMARDKKARDGIRLVLCAQPGLARLVDAPPRTLLAQALHELSSEP